MEEEGKTKGERTEMQRKLSILLNYMYMYIHSSKLQYTIVYIVTMSSQKKLLKMVM